MKFDNLQRVDDDRAGRTWWHAWGAFGTLAGIEHRQASGDGVTLENAVGELWITVQYD